MNRHYPMGAVSEIAGLAATEAVNKVHLGELRSLGAVEDFIQLAMSNWLTKFGPQLGQQMMAIAEPAAQKAAEVIGPVVEEKLRAYGPKLALLTGVIVGAAIIFGVGISKREFRRSRS